jgi:acyl-CoA thioesterase FadM
MERRHQPTRRLESSYPFIHELRSQFRDLDPLRHVNNVVVAAYYEDARTHFLRHQLGRSGGTAEQKMSWAGGPFHFLIANVEIDYLGVAHHPRAFRIGVGVSRIGSASVTISQALFQEAPASACATPRSWAWTPTASARWTTNSGPRSRRPGPSSLPTTSRCHSAAGVIGQPVS